jgi:hypothetical protein
MPNPQTIQIFLPDGSPTSIKEVELTNRLIKLIFFSRNSIEKAAKREMVNNTGVYFLFGENEQGKAQVYIGEGENTWKRIQQHERKKDFWTHAVIATSKTDEFTKTDAKFLEFICLEKAKDAKRYSIENETGSREPSLPEPRKYDMLDNFETIKLLITTLGYPLFENLKSKAKSSEERYFCKGKDASAEALITDEGVFVLKGSKANIDVTNTVSTGIINLRENLLSNKILKQTDNVYLFNDDHLFNSPSTAAAVVLGRSANGWKLWKNAKGKSLDEVKRKP